MFLMSLCSLCPYVKNTCVYVTTRNLILQSSFFPLVRAYHEMKSSWLLIFYKPRGMQYKSTHWLINSLKPNNSQRHQLAYSLNHKLTSSQTHQLKIQQLINSQTHQFINSKAHQLTNPSTQTHQLTNSLTQTSSTHQLTNLITVFYFTTSF